jgi:RNA polymerase sigma-54 factor
MLRQNLSQKMLQKLSPQQIQLMKLLQVPTANLEQRIKQEMEVNPALEEGGQELESDIYEEDREQEAEERDDERLDDDFDLEDYFDDDESAYKTRDTNYGSQDDDNRTIPVAVKETFHEFLETQVGMLELDDRQYQIALHLVGSIGDDGYLRREIEAIVDDLAFSQNIQTNESEIEEVLKEIQGFEPPGVGARSLQECLILQLERKEESSPNVRMAIRILKENFDTFAKKHYDKLQKTYDLDEEDLKHVLDEVIRLNPKPGCAFGSQSKVHQYIIPDFIITNENGELDLRLNARNAPELRVSDSFKEMMRSYKEGGSKDKKAKEAVMFIKQKIDSAKWFIDAIRQRQHTMMQVMTAIVNHQEEFFLTGDETKLNPMILKNIAEVTGLDISTVSRVANSKYVQTEFGTYLLKYFFSESLQTESGEEVSTREVKKILQDMIDGENKKKPLSDQKLMEGLKKKGYNIARRTVAKYREQLNIPVARLRKEL